MMRHTRQLVVILLLALVACTSSPAGTGVANPPTVPTTSYSPDFDANVDVVAVTDTGDADGLSLVRELTRPEELYLSGPAANWENLFLAGPVNLARVYRARFRIFGDTLAEMAASDEDFELSTDVSTLLLGGVRLVDASAPWAARVRITDSGLIRVVILNRADGRVWGYYLFDTDESGDPVRGFFAFVNFEKLAHPTQSGVRFLGIAFDFTEAITPRLVTSMDYYDEDIGRGLTFLLLQECGRDEATCLGELLLVTSAPPSRIFSENSVRVQWDRDSHAVCLASISYDDGTELGTTQSFTGPDVPEDAAVSEDSCTLTAPGWSDRIYTVEDLPLRYEDTSTPGGFATTITGENGDESDWEAALTESLLDDWLDGIF